MSHGLLWFPLLLAFVLLASLGWLERRRQNLFRSWAEGSELAKLDGCGGARLKDGEHALEQLRSRESFKIKGCFDVCRLELVELMALASGDAPLTDEAQGRCRCGSSERTCRWMFPSADADRARSWGEQLMARARCDLVSRISLQKRAERAISAQMARRRELRRQRRQTVLASSGALWPCLF